MKGGIKAIGFDYSGVITNPSRKFLALMGGIIGVPLGDLRTAWFKRNRMINVDSVDNRTFYKTLLGDLGMESKLEAVLEHENTQPLQTINTEMLDLIDRLRKSGYKVGLLSNSSTREAAKMRTLGLDKHFDVFLISGEIGYQKPDKEAFKIFTEKLGVEPEEMIYIDDTRISLENAGEIGFIPILYRNFPDLVKQLSSFISFR